MSDPDFYIETPRLYLHYFIPTNPKHCDFLVELYNSPLFISTEGETGITTAEKAKERIESRFVAEHRRNNYGTFLVSLKPETPTTKKLEEATLIGSVGLTKGDAPEAFPAPDVGFAMVPEMVNKGYATESARALLDYVKKKLGLVEVLGFTDPTNTPSQRVMEKLGMESKGVKKLKPFGGKEGMVFVLPGMAPLEKYGIDE